MEYPTESEIKTALTLVDFRERENRAESDEWRAAFFTMRRYCKKEETSSDACARILAEAYRTTLADLNGKE